MHYFDHAATTPMFAEAIEAMTAQLGRVGNPSSLHSSGRMARRVVEEAREQLAQALGARPSEVVFTGGGTEADNLAIKGLCWARRAEDDRRRRVLVSAVEHHAVLDPAAWLADAQAAELELLPVDGAGRVDVAAVRETIERDPDSVALISIMLANNEVGTVQPITELVPLARAHGIPFHADAVQAVGQLPVDFADSGLTAMTITGHKIGGPVGVGALVLSKDVSPVPVLHGGGQERDVRSGTLDAPAVAALGVAAELAVKRQPETVERLTQLRDDLIGRLRGAVPDAIVNGDGAAGLDARLPAIAHFSFPGCEGDALLMLLDARGIECSTGSACSAGVAEPSHVLLAMGEDADLARGSLRFSLGHTSTQADVDALVEAIGPAVERARRAGLTNAPRRGAS